MISGRYYAAPLLSILPGNGAGLRFQAANGIRPDGVPAGMTGDARLATGLSCAFALARTYGAGNISSCRRRTVPA